MLKQVILPIVVLALLPLVLKLAIKTRMIVPLLYMAIVSIFFPIWAEAHPTLSLSILGLLIFLVIASWLRPVLSRIREERMIKKALLLQIRTIREATTEPLSATIRDGVPIVSAKE